eukprot:144101-Hanusia_phi.AAC.5
MLPPDFSGFVHSVLKHSAYLILSEPSSAPLTRSPCSTCYALHFSLCCPPKHSPSPSQCPAPAASYFFSKPITVRSSSPSALQGFTAAWHCGSQSQASASLLPRYCRSALSSAEVKLPLPGPVLGRIQTSDSSDLELPCQCDRMSRVATVGTAAWIGLPSPNEISEDLSGGV